MIATKAGAVELSQRGDVRLGYRCNARCGFCYYQDKLDTPTEQEPTIEQLTDRLRQLRRQGATEVEFTGGEPTIRSDLPMLIALAKSVGFVNISVISNGLRLSNPLYATQLIEAGANDFLLSIHGHTPQLHDGHTRIPGSFQKILTASVNIRSQGIRVRYTATVTGKNHAHLSELLAKFIELDAACIHLAVFSPVADAAMHTDPDMFVRYSDAGASIRRAIDRHRHHLPPLSVKYIPFCFMRGYENFVMNLYQQSFDPDDWNYYLSNKTRRARTWAARSVFDAIVGIGGLLAKDYAVPISHGWAGWKTFGLTRLVELLRKQRTSACRSCRYDIVCDHVWKDYVKHYGDAEIQPVPGPRISDPAWCYDLARYRTPGVAITTTQPSAVEPHEARSGVPR